MGAFIFKQPNGRYGRFSTIVDCPTHFNMTREDYVELLMERNGYNRKRAEEEADDIFAHYLKPYSECLDSFVDNNMTNEEFQDIRYKMELLTDELTAWLEKTFYRDNINKYRRHFKEWFDNLTGAQIAGFYHQMEVDKSGVLNKQSKKI